MPSVSPGVAGTQGRGRGVARAWPVPVSRSPAPGAVPLPPLLLVPVPVVSGMYAGRKRRKPVPKRWVRGTGQREPGWALGSAWSRSGGSQRRQQHAWVTGF